MSGIVLKSPLGGSVKIESENTPYDVVVKAPAKNATLLTDSDLSAPGGSALVGYQPAGTNAVSTSVQSKLRLFVTPEDFGAVGNGVTDDYLAIQAAIDYVASLTGVSHDGSSTINNWPIGNTRCVYFRATKYATSKKIILKNNVSLFANGGGLLALPGFIVGDYVLTTEGTEYYEGQVKDLVIDGNNLNVKGLNIYNVLGTTWGGIRVSNCKNDGITYSGGADFTLDGFIVSGAETPVSNSVAGLKTVGASDAAFSNGVCRFTPIGVYMDGGGNNEFENIHCWGGYANLKQYINFYIKGSYRNSLVSCYADSPTKQDYLQNNTASIGGIPNGGVCFYFERSSVSSTGSQDNSLVNCRPYVNWVAYTNAGLPANQLLYGYVDAYCFTNSITNLIDVGGTPSGVTDAFATDRWQYWSTAVKDLTLLFTSVNPVIPSLRISKEGDPIDRLVPLTINNTDNAYSNSGTKIQFSVAGVEKGSVIVTQGVGGTSPEMFLTSGTTGSVKLSSAGQLAPVLDNTQNLGSASSRWSVVYAGTGTINTSDEREKQDVADYDEVEKRVAIKLKSLIKKFRFKDAVATKGEDARIHSGVVAQEVISAFESEGLDPMKYAIICYDEWPATIDDAGNEISPSGNRYGVRYEELLSFIISAI